MKMSLLTTVILSVGLISLSAQTVTLDQVATPRTFNPGSPRYSDVIMRSQSACKGTSYGASASDRISAVENVVGFGMKYHITRLDWSYFTGISNPTLRNEVVSAIKDKGWNFGGALNASTFSSNASIKDLYGNPTRIPHFNAGVYAGCVNNPVFRAEYQAELQSLCELGPDTIQADDTEMAYGLARGAVPGVTGCYCQYCNEAAADSGFDIVTYPADMLIFQKMSVMNFHSSMLSQLHFEDNGSPVPLSANGEWTTDIYGEPFDYNFAERTLWGCFRPIVHWDVAKRMASAGRSMVYSGQDDLTLVDPYVVKTTVTTSDGTTTTTGQDDLSSFGTRVTVKEVTTSNGTTTKTFLATENTTNGYRYEIGICYATGINFMVPWDQWLKDTSNTKRYWGDPALFADLYGFVRANAHFLDGYEDALIAGWGGWTTESENITSYSSEQNGLPPDNWTYQMIDKRYGGSPLPVEVVSPGNPRPMMSAFGRAIPGDPTAPKVLHLLEYWGGTHERKIRLNVPSFFPVDPNVGLDKAITVRLHCPRAYDADLHADAEGIKNYSPLCEVIPLKVTPEANGYCTVTVPCNNSTEPGVNPWGFLVIEKGGIQGHWSFDGNGSDYSPNGLNATITPYGECSDDSRYSTSALILNGSTSYASVADDSRLDIGTGDFAFATWIKRDPNPTTNLRVLSKGAGYDTDSGYAMWASDSVVCAAVSDGSSRIIVGKGYRGPGQWTHVTVNVKRNDKISLYIDGKFATSLPCTSFGTKNINSARDFNIGRNAAGSLHWPGAIDDVRIYNRVLSDSEIKLMANVAVQ